jgi:hypothetical protein
VSQEIVKNLLLELGGSAFTREIRDIARKKFPTASLYKYVDIRLKSLEKWGEVESEFRRSERGVNMKFWRIVQK